MTLALNQASGSLNNDSAPRLQPYSSMNAGPDARHLFLGPNYWAADMSLFRNFNLGDRLNAETFNVFNHTNFQLGGPTGPSGKNTLNNASSVRRVARPIREISYLD